MHTQDRVFTMRIAEPGDEKTILTFIKELAEYERMLDEVVATEQLLCDWLFKKGVARCIIAEEDGEPVGFALFFYNFSTFLGRAGIYLEDLYVRPSCRGRGYGKKLLIQLASLAKSEGCGRLEWSCLNWNTPSINFYLSLGALPLSDWTTYRVDGATLDRLAAQSEQ